MSKERKNREEKTNAPTLAKPYPQSNPMARTGSVESLFGYTPFRLMRRFTEDMERLFEDFGETRLTPYFEREWNFPQLTEVDRVVMWSPQIEVHQHEGKLTVRADLPGMKKDDVIIEIADNVLIISGERKQESEEKRDGYYRSECNYGSFSRAIPLPESAKIEDAKATFQNGVLEINLEVPEQKTAGRRIEINEPKETTPTAKAATK